MKAFNRCLTVAAIILLISGTAHALTVTGEATSTFIFDMLVNADGTVTDDGTIKLDGRFTKTEVKTVLKPFTKDSIIFGDTHVYEVAGLPLVSGDNYADSIWFVYYDSSGYTVYVYRYHGAVEKEEQW